MKLDFHDPQSGGLSEQQTGGTIQRAGGKNDRTQQENRKNTYIGCIML